MIRKINLFDEIIAILEENNKGLCDILWIGTRISSIDKEKFLQKAKKTNYDNGYGAQQIAPDLIIVGTDWWLAREEYDGSEWWSYNTYPQRPEMKKKKYHIKGYGSLFEEEEIGGGDKV